MYSFSVDISVVSMLRLQGCSFKLNHSFATHTLILQNGTTSI